MKSTEHMTAMAQERYGDFILGAGKTFLTIRAQTVLDGRQHVKIRMEDVARYYRIEAGNLSSGMRSIAGLPGDWRQIDHLAQISLDWFKRVNIDRMRQVSREFGLEPKF